MAKRNRSTSNKVALKTKNKSNKKRVQPRSSKLPFEKLEPRHLLASVGWDGIGQGTAELSYYVGDAPTSVGQETFESVIEDALAVWSDVAGITFTQTETPRQTDSLDITFSRLDGAGGTLAQAYLPDDVNWSRVAGDIQFDSSENWELGNARGGQAFDLMLVAVHEIGHALGLEHNDLQGSVMNDTVTPFQSFSSLSQVDESEILNLYAPVNKVTQPPVVPPNPTTPVSNPVAPVAPTIPEVDAPVDPVNEIPSRELPEIEPSSPIDNSTETELPETETPETETPESETPESETPEVELPDSDGSGDDDTPAEDVPEERPERRRRHPFSWLWNRRRRFIPFFNFDRSNTIEIDLADSKVDTNQSRSRFRVVVSFGSRWIRFRG